MASKVLNVKKNTQKNKQEIVKQVVVKEERAKASMAAVRYAEFLVLPSEGDSVVPAPSPIPIRETVIRKNLVVDLASNNSAGNFYLEVKAHCSDTLSVTQSISDTQDQGAFTFTDSIMLTPVQLAGDLSSDKGLGTHLTTGSQARLTQIADASGLKKMGYMMDGTNDTTLRVVNWAVETNASTAVTAKIWFLAAASNWAAATAVTINCPGGVPVYSLQNNVTVPANCIGISISCSAPRANSATPLVLSCTLNQASSGLGLLAFEKQVLNTQSMGLDIVDSIQDLMSWRVIAQDVLVTFEGDTLNDGGAIACARVPKDWQGGQGLNSNPYGDILKLPYDRYDGALKHGCHVHWIPGDIDDLSPVNSIEEDEDFGFFKMVVAGKMTHPDASIRVRVCTAVAYYSTNPDYGRMDWAPPPTDLGLMLQYVARVVPAATENDSHILKKIRAFAGKNLNQGIRYLKDNPEMLAKLSMALLSAL